MGVAVDVGVGCRVWALARASQVVMDRIVGVGVGVSAWRIGVSVGVGLGIGVSVGVGIGVSVGVGLGVGVSVGVGLGVGVSVGVGIGVGVNVGVGVGVYVGVGAGVGVGVDWEGCTGIWTVAITWFVSDTRSSAIPVPTWHPTAVTVRTPCCTGDLPSNPVLTPITALDVLIIEIDVHIQIRGSGRADRRSLLEHYLRRRGAQTARRSRRTGGSGRAGRYGCAGGPGRAGRYWACWWAEWACWWVWV